MKRGETIGIVGAGTFGTALANVVARAGREVMIWSQTRDVVDEINRGHLNTPRLPDVELAPLLRATSDPAELAASARFIVMAIPSTDVRGRARTLGAHVDGGHLLVHAIGALAQPRESPTGSLSVASVLTEETPVLRVGVLAGPALPRALVESRYASMVVASKFDEVVTEGRRLLAVPPQLRIYGSRDPVGAELAAALSGAYTIAVGLSDSLDVGPGLRAVLMTRIVAEAARIGAALGADPRTFYGLAGLGNLLVRSSRDSAVRSKDYVLGLALGAGEPVASQPITEGVRAAQTGTQLAQRLGVHTPVLAALHGVLVGEMTAAEAASAAADTVADEE